jgi:uncharacterized membrane protein
MYEVALLLHSYTRWLVLIVMVWALVRVWGGLVRKRAWNVWDTRASAAFAGTLSLQFIFGLLVYFQPYSIAQTAWIDWSVSMGQREFRFFGLEHPLQMIIAIALAHMGNARAKKAVDAARKYRIAALCFTIAAVLILAAIPWWRPLLRAIQLG